MEEEKKGFVGIQNWVGKLILMVVGVLWLSSHLYPHFKSGFFLTDRVVDDWGSVSDFAVVTVSASMILGGYYLNTVLDFIKNKFK